MKNKIDLAQNVLSLSIKKVGLLRELRESLKYEQCLFDIVQFGDKFSVFEIATKKEKYHGSKDSVLMWFNNRKIEHDKIYNIDKLLPKLEVTKTWKDSGEIEMVSIDDAVNKLKDCYVGDIFKLLRDGKILQSSFAYYEIKLSNN